ncbi:DUF5623 domain-containing protein [Pseudomonas sp. TCU-HL1]|uniref:DUF5623 domain-containing protein n=1 Tax=Pseudomonas sp. TCU-HL1 TaxID=1856685 RepID=UPI00083D7A21|nr:DUF5623 domain-containing protein [Pseudomonas sp. TCU-HL1]AOE83764.1 hypothetical protein THL1_1216 [Pseudomonas sp. TCU-HL1]
MVTIVTPPSTVDGIKRLAKAIKREFGIPHTQALEEAAQKAGFQNFIHAKRAIAQTSSLSYVVYISAYWRDRQSTPVNAGRETMQVVLSKPLTDLVTSRQVHYCRNLKGFKLEAADHLERIQDTGSKERAVEELHRAADTLSFLQTTGLIPAHLKPHFEKMELMHRLPGADHASWWIDPQSTEWVVLDEPYLHRSSQARTDWFVEHNLKVVQPAWPGLYYPGQSIPYLISQSSALLERLQHQLMDFTENNLLPRKLHSDNYFSQFISPTRAVSGKKRKSRPFPAYGDRNGATPYGGAPGVPSLWRPARPMPLEVHSTIGPIFQKLCSSSVKKAGITGRVYDRLNNARSLLEDWAYAEHKGNITREIEETLYYVAGVEECQTHQEAVDAITAVRIGILNGYQECKPRRDLLVLIDGALKEVIARASK